MLNANAVYATHSEKNLTDRQTSKTKRVCSLKPVTIIRAPNTIIGKKLFVLNCKYETSPYMYLNITHGQSFIMPVTLKKDSLGKIKLALSFW